MDPNHFSRRLMATFLEELGEHVQALNRDLLALEQAGPRGPAAAGSIKTLFRTAHSLKGAARSVGVGVIEDSCHHLEDVLAVARDRGYLDPSLFGLLFQTADAVADAGRRLRDGQGLEGGPLDRLSSRLEDAALSAADAPLLADGVSAGAGHVESQPGEREALAPRVEPPALAAFAGPTPVVATGPTALPLANGAHHNEPTAAEPDATGPASVRVAAEKLDALLARSGELLVDRRRVQARADDLSGLREFVRDWRAEWVAVERAGGRSRRAGTPTDALPRAASLAVAQAGERLRQLETRLDQIGTALGRDVRALDRSADAVDDEVHRVRMLPFETACQGLERAVRDVARAAGKDAELVIENGAVALDRSILDGLRDPLMHLVRNSADHGLEAPDDRRAAGKPPRGRLTVSAVIRGSGVEVTVADDGRGLDLSALRQQARKRGLAEPADDREAAALVFLPGLSTAKAVTGVSGRGVGLDVVKSRVEALHGRVDVASDPGRGVRFTLSLPLTLTTLQVLLVSAGGQTYAVPSTAVQKLLRADLGTARWVEGRRMLPLGGPPVPVVPLADALGVAGGGRPGTVKVPAVVLAAGDRRAAFVVDEFVSEQEVLVKSLGDRVRRLPHVTAASILPSGRIALVLNAGRLIDTALARTPGRAPAPAAAPAARPRVLVAEDSVTTRTLQKTILETAGYEVLTAPDGLAAWRLLQAEPVSILVSDVDMPGLDGFALTRQVRADARLADLPVVLVTSRGSDEDKTRGVEAGADAYVVKGGFDQTALLETVARLVG